jgi:hypothetical protein
MTMTQHAFPSDAFPALPALALDAPDHWSRVIAPGSVVSLVWPREEGHFTPNVVVSVTRFDRGYAFNTATDALDAQLTSLQEAEVTARDKGQLDGRDAYVQEVVFVDDAVGSLVQVNLVVLVDHGPVVDLVHVAGTAAGDRLESDYAEVREIVQSLAVTV